ncbi:C45 family peptidase [Rubripirellula sp.]|nr:C45 family peptidase [Rubripirellula sp.]MDB4624968.1 C45 family peptidase [Rubripirellula sp.]
MTDPLPQVACYGDARELGRQQGEALRENIRSAISTIGELEAFRLMKPGLMPMRWFRRLAEVKADRFMKTAFRKAPGDFEQRFLGICEGANLPAPKLALCCLLEAVMSDLTRSSQQRPNGMQAGCSAIAVTGEASKDGAARVMHNFDHVPVVQQFFVVRRSRPVGKLRSVEFTLSPLLGAVDGVNEAGLGVTCNYAYVTDSMSAGPTITMLISRVLSEATNVEQAIEIISSQDRVGGGLLMLADAAGAITSLEVSNSRVQTRSPRQGIVFHTNRLQCVSMASVEIGADACYDKRAPNLLRGKRVHESADLRSNAIQNAVKGKGPLSLDDMHGILSDHAHGKSCNSLCMHGGYWSTTACTQLMPRERKLRVAFANSCQAKLQEFEC